MNKSNIVNSFIWKFSERIGIQGMQFIVQIILARLLAPKDYGTIALITVFIAVANIFVQNGLSTALIQDKDASEEDFSSVFYTSLILAGIIYIILFFATPLIANFYQIEELIKIIRVLSLTLFIGVFNSVQNAIISKGMEFKKLFYSSLGGIVISGSTGILLAYRNYGVWALVYQQLLNQLLSCIILWFLVKWRPQKVFSIKRLRKLFSFSSKLLASSLLDTIYNNIMNLIVGKLYSPILLGYYSRGMQFPSLIVTNVSSSIQAILFPVLSREQNSIENVKNIMRNIIKKSSYLLFPLLTGLAVIAEPMVRVLLTEKWLPLVPYIRIFCITYALYPIHTTNLQGINALGRSDLFLKLEIMKKIIGVSVMFYASRYGVLTMALCTIITSITSSFINSFPNKKLIKYGYLEQLKDMLPPLILSLIMGITIYLIKYLGYMDIVTMCLQITSGIVIYIVLSYLFKIESFMEILKLIKTKEHKE